MSSMISGVSGTDAEKARLAVIAIEAEGNKLSVRLLRERAGLANETAMRCLRALRAGEVHPASEGPWTSAPWAAFKDEKRRAEDARDMRAALRGAMDKVHDDALPQLAAAIFDLPCDLRRAAASVGGFTADELEGHTLGPDPVCTVGQWIEHLGRVDASPE